MRNFPNPFRGATRIAFSLPSAPRPQPVDVAIYDIQGRRVAQLVDETLPSGHYTVRWDGHLEDGARLATGTYLCRVRFGDQQVSTTMTLMR